MCNSHKQRKLASCTVGHVWRHFGRSMYVYTCIFKILIYRQFPLSAILYLMTEYRIFKSNAFDCLDWCRILAAMVHVECCRAGVPASGPQGFLEREATPAEQGALTQPAQGASKGTHSHNPALLCSPGNGLLL